MLVLSGGDDHVVGGVTVSTARTALIARAYGRRLSPTPLARKSASPAEQPAARTI
jgi:hypothetical protein